jgi:dienelactone hydrolase
MELPMNARLFVLVLSLIGGAEHAFGQDYKPPEAIVPDDETRTEIGARSRRLSVAVDTMRRQGLRDPILADVEVYLKAAEWISKHNEYYHKDAGNWTLEVLDRGLLRASQAMRGDVPWLATVGQTVVRGYRSRLDGSIQPYAVTFPKEYGVDLRVKWRTDVVLHGRDPSLTEVKFLHQHMGNKPADDRPYVQVDIYGRGNNAYRWAGESDVQEVIENYVTTERALGRGDLLDHKQFVLRGFSMGGAGTWHLGLHRPDRWAVIGPGAGFTATHGYVKDLPETLPDYVEKCLRIYDAVDYSPNAFNVPIVAYAGADDPQLQAARNIEAKLKPLNIPMTLLVAPGLKHQFPKEWEAKAEAEYAKVFARQEKGRREYPDRVRFVTYTLRYPSCDFVEILGLETHYELAEVDASRVENGFHVKTKNVRGVKLALPPGDSETQVVRIDGQELSARPSASVTGTMAVCLEKIEGKWEASLPQRITTGRFRRLQKFNGMQGPIDDAFTDSFLCVRGKGSDAWNPAIEKYAEAEIERFRAEWNKYFRGQLVVKNDTDVTDEDIATRSLILFGDPGSNSLIAQVLHGLPLKWTKESISFGGKTYDASTHVPALVYPSPLNVGRYVVLNTGHTFHASDFQGTNALLYPRLGDYAIMRLKTTKDDPLAVEVATAGLFDEFWKP